MGLIVRTVIKETSTHKTIYTIENTDTQELYDVDREYIMSNINNIDNALYDFEGIISSFSGDKLIIKDAQHINIKNIKNTGGTLVRGLNDLETYCRKNNKQEWLEFYLNATNNLKPTDITYSSSKIINVKCTHCGYERSLKLGTFTTTQKNACPACQSENHARCMLGVNDFYTYCKENKLDYLLEEYNDEYDLTTLAKGSHKKVKWKCKYGHEWTTSLEKRALHYTGCPKCQGSQTSKTERAVSYWLQEQGIKVIERGRIEGEEFDLNIVDYNILIEFNSDSTHISERALAKDKKKHEIAKRLNKHFIVLMQTGTPVFDETLYYDILFRTDKKNYLEDLLIKLSEKLKELGLNVDTTISLDAKAKANKNDVPFERSLLGVYPEITELWSDKNEVSPDVVYANSRRYITLKCKKCEQDYSIRSDALKQSWDKETKGCPYCTGTKVLKGVTDLETLAPELAKEWSSYNLLKPSDVTLYSNKKINWVCSKCGHNWDAMINLRTGVNKEGCPACAGKVSCNAPIPEEDILEGYDF